MIVNAKIFPHRRINSDKGRAVAPDAPPLPHASEEDQALMRELLKEQREASLTKRAALLNNKVVCIPKPQQRYTFYFEPELVGAFDKLPRAIWKQEFRKFDQRNGPSPNQAMKESLPWLKQFQQQKQFFCRDCSIEITAQAAGRVPWEIAATGPLNGPYQISGLCADCMEKGHDGMVSYISNSRIICTEH